jgi:hypothetical protein
MRGGGDSSVITVNGYGLDDWGSIPRRDMKFFFYNHNQTDYGVHRVSYPKATEVSFMSVI